MTPEETVALAEGALGRRLTDPVDLGGSRRSRVLRCDVGEALPGASRDALPDGTKTVIVKQFLGRAPEFGRESVGLAVLDRTPELYARDPANHLLVMSDLGDLPTLADLLLGDDRERAWQGARAWARALGELVGRSRPAVGDARARLAADLAADELWDLQTVISLGLDKLAEAAGDRLDRPAVEAELASIGGLTDPGEAAVVWPGDTCPDNAVVGTEGWLFLDLEGTGVEHASAVAAYTVLPFASCWCVFDPPAGLTDDLLAEFTEGLAVHAPQLAGDPAWPVQVRQACAVYSVLAGFWFLDSAREGRANVGPAGRSPSYRQILGYRWRWGALNLRDDFPALAAALGGAAAWASETWGPEAEIGGYPAFAPR